MEKLEKMVDEFIKKRLRTVWAEDIPALVKLLRQLAAKTKADTREEDAKIADQRARLHLAEADRQERLQTFSTINKDKGEEAELIAHRIREQK